MVEDTSIKQAARTCAGFTLSLIGSYVLNGLIFPYFDAVGPEARDISTYCGVLFFIVLAVIAYRKPSVFHEKIWTTASFAVIIVGSILLYLGITQNSALFLLTGSPFGGIGPVWFTVLVCISLTKLSTKQCALCIPLAFVLKYVAMVMLSFISVSLIGALALMFACTFVSYLLVLPYAAKSIKTIQKVEAAAELDVTNPRSFLPFSSPVFISIVLFNVADGYALTFQPESGSLPPMVIAFIPVVVILLIVVIGHKHLNADKLFLTSALLIFAGFLLAPLSLMSAEGLAGAQAASVCLRSGTDCFSLLLYLLIAAVGARNELSTISMVALTIGSSWLGIAIGALLGQVTSGLAPADPTVMLWVSVLITFAFVVYNFVILRRFSFEETIQGIQPIPHITLKKPEEESPTLDESCDVVIGQYGLTNREGDVLRLLARGRTSSVIQEKLFLSHNTVKTHVRHVYTKLGIHSQQELIDIIEATAK